MYVRCQLVILLEQNLYFRTHTRSAMVVPQVFDEPGVIAIWGIKQLIALLTGCKHNILRHWTHKRRIGYVSGIIPSLAWCSIVKTPSKIFFRESPAYCGR